MTTTKIRFEVYAELPDGNDFHETCAEMQRRLEEVDYVKSVKLLVAVGGFT